MGTELKQVFAMKEGISDTSYVKCSYIQKQVLSFTKSIKEEAMRELYVKHCPKILCMADLGCSSAEQNTLCVVSELIETVERTRAELGLELAQGYDQVPQGQVYQIYLNDLPSNDFNTLFQSVTGFRDDLKGKLGVGFGNCFVNGVPGSFYERLFPDNTLHFVHSSYSLHWLSQVPEGIDDNEKNIFIAKTSPPSVCKAYFEQFQKDFMAFLECRSKEVVAAGRMVLTLIGRDTDEPYSVDSCHMWEMLGYALNDMVSEGYIEEERVKTFNFPNYFPSSSELEFLVRKQGGFDFNQADVFKINWDSTIGDKNHTNGGFDRDPSYEFARCMQSVAEPLIINHFGEGVTERVFQKYIKNVRVFMAQEDGNFVNVTVSLTRNNAE